MQQVAGKSRTMQQVTWHVADHDLLPRRCTHCISHCTIGSMALCSKRCHIASLPPLPSSHGLCVRLQFLVHIGKKLTSLHAAGWVHRDLKPGAHHSITLNSIGAQHAVT